MGVPVNTLSLAGNLLELCKALFAHKSDANGHNLASQTKAGFMSPYDKAKLDAMDDEGILDGSITTDKLASYIDLGLVSQPISEGGITVDKLAGTLDLGMV
jgi:hypothetical protein